MRILLVNTQSVNHQNATGITLREILRSLPDETVGELYLQPCRRAPDALDIVSRRVPFGVCAVRHLANRFLKSGGDAVPAPAAPPRQRRLKGRLIMMLDFEPVVLTPKLRRWVREFAPDCIYTLGNGIDTMKLACRLADLCGVPLLPHFMDNWPASHRQGPHMYPTHLRMTQKWLTRLYERASCALTISEKMAREYEAQRHIPHYALMNFVPAADYFCGAALYRTLKTVVYAGGLHLHRYRSLLEIGQTLLRYRETTGQEILLHVYTDEKSRAAYGELLGGCPVIRLHPAVPHGEIVRVYRQADVLVHIETFDAEYRDFIRYSLSTKISEYLATGKPILLYAPADICVSEYLREHEAAVTVSESGELEAALCRLASGGEAVENLGDNAYRLALEKHDAAVNRAKIRDIFSRVCGQQKRG